MYRLISIRFSHYNEKARWGLERHGLAYKEHGFMPVLHMPAVALATRGRSENRADKVSSPLSTPVLICPDGRRICDSSEILRYLNDRHGDTLYDAPRTEELEQRFHDELGPHTRRVAYYYVLDDREAMTALADGNVGVAQRVLFRIVYPLGKSWMQSRMRIDEAGLLKSKERIARCLDDMDELLRDGRPYLLGDHLGAADISLACMLVPALIISPAEGFGAYLPQLEEGPKEFQDYARELRERPSGKHALRMFAEERHSTPL